MVENQQAESVSTLAQRVRRRFGEVISFCKTLWPSLKQPWAPLAKLLGPSFFSGLGMALFAGGQIWLIFTAHPLALALVLIGTAIWGAAEDARRVGGRGPKGEGKRSAPAANPAENAPGQKSG